ncbi:MAG TPA: glycosyltransferase family 2 protein [Bacteroidia bacterium]|nr:glycosyltransferase family 2 protein [Bacteroidia bacterium]
MIAVSVVIPCRNEKKYIGKCITSVLQSDFPYGEFEILVCDGKSDDGTADIIRGLSAQHPNVIYVENREQVTPYALNYGAKKARGEVVIILGAHAEVDKNYLKLCYEFLRDEKELGCVGGLLDNVFEDEISEAIAGAMSSRFGVGNAHFRTGTAEGYVDTVAFGAYKREVFEKVGYFDEELVRNQDDEFNYRVTKAGYRIRLSKDIRAKYYVRAGFRKLFRQYYQYGYWKVYVNKKHKAVTTMRQLVPPAFVAFLIGGALLSALLPFAWMIYAGLLALYLLGSFVSAIPVAKNPAGYFRTVISFWILHVSYGAGYLEGIFHFIVLGRKPSGGRQASSR